MGEYHHKLYIVILFLLFTAGGLNARITMPVQEQISLLEQSSIYLDDQEMSLEEIIRHALFKPYRKPTLNIGVQQKKVWIALPIHNPSMIPVERLLVINSPLIEHITLYRGKEKSAVKGRAHLTPSHTSLGYTYTIDLDANSTTPYYLLLYSDYTPVNFTLLLAKKSRYDTQDKREQVLISLLMGVIIALMLYNFLISFYTRDRGYLYYSVYLFALLYQQATYTGLAEIYFSPAYNIMDMKLSNLKGGFAIVTSALFAMYFLKIEKIPLIYRLYKLTFVIIAVEMLYLYTTGTKSMMPLSVTAILYLFFTLIAGIVSYQKGNKQARLFLLGFSLLFISYLFMALDALGITSIMTHNRNILIWSTSLDALILSLAFADRYRILQTQKKQADERILEESQYREKRIQMEVIEKTAQLNQALEIQKLLLQEVHHRVKNNLQIILSMLRMQKDEIGVGAVQEKLSDLESRIEAISKIYNLLLIRDQRKEIDMQTYIEVLMGDISQIFGHTRLDIETEVTAEIYIPLKEAVYLGLIINELVTNAYKHAFDSRGGKIMVSIKQEAERCQLMIKDNGKGFMGIQKRRTLGLRLVETLVYQQLKGSMEILREPHTAYTIYFRIENA